MLHFEAENAAASLQSPRNPPALYFSIRRLRWSDPNRPVSRVRESVAIHGRSRQELDAVIRQVTAAVRQAFLGVRDGIASVRVFEAAVASSESQLDATRLGRGVELRTRVDMLNAQQQLYQAQRDLAAIRYAYALSHLRLCATIGR
jgi:outer membrane protein